MKNFDLKKYLAEGKLLKENNLDSLIDKYGQKLIDFVIRVDQLTSDEAADVEYLEDRIEIHLEEPEIRQKYLAEGKLHEENQPPKFKIGDYVQPIEGATAYMNDEPRGTITSKYIGVVEDVKVNRPEKLRIMDGEYLYAVEKLNYKGGNKNAYDFKESDLESIPNPMGYIKGLEPYRRR